MFIDSYFDLHLSNLLHQYGHFKNMNNEGYEFHCGNTSNSLQHKLCVWSKHYNITLLECSLEISKFDLINEPYDQSKTRELKCFLWGRRQAVHQVVSDHRCPCICNVEELVNALPVFIYGGNIWEIEREERKEDKPSVTSFIKRTAKEHFYFSPILWVSIRVKKW